ncbi:MAG: AAA family ATPase [Myxococcales bacterium]|nr:AAA family ATPase [Myxococcales bacterium]
MQREALVELVALCAVAGEHLLVLGPPGTAKSEAVRRIAQRLGGSYFEYLIGRFTEPTEIFGPIDLRRLREGVVETETAGMLPEAELAFLDEIFLGSTAILNTLLGVLNERTFRRGHTHVRCPLRVCVGASNALPEEEQGGQLAAFADRFLVRTFVEPIADSGLEELLSAGWTLGGAAAAGPASGATLEHIDLLAQTARAMDLSAVRGELAQAIRLLRGAGIELSDRRIVRLQRLVAAAAALAGRRRPTSADLWPIIYALPTQAAQRTGREVLRELLAASHSSSLLAAAAESSQGPLARGARLQRDAAALLAAEPLATPTDGDAGAPAVSGDAGAPAASSDARADARATWHLRLESMAREIDAAFALSSMPEELAAVRAEIVQHIRAGHAATLASAPRVTS